MAASTWIACESVTAAADSSTPSPGQTGEERQDTGAGADAQYDITQTVCRIAYRKLLVRSSSTSIDW